MREYRPVTQQLIFDHLTGKEVIGIYPYLPEGTCRFLVFDFDNHTEESEKNDFANEIPDWIEEVNALRNVCLEAGVDPLIERSRSGRGAHVWIFFEKPLPVKKARMFGNALLQKGASSVSMKSFVYYDRMLPAQDVLPEGAIGNLIALPLQPEALRNGNSAFVDEAWNAYPQQWKVLLSKQAELAPAREPEKQQRFFLPLCCSECPLYAMAGETLRLRSAQKYDNLCAAAKDEVDAKLHEGGRAIIEKYFNMLITKSTPK